MSTVPFRFSPLMLIATAVLALAGCVTPWQPGMSSALEVAPAKITASGLGSTANYSQYNSGQQRLMATRAAQVDAYRNLAERVRGFRIAGATSVSAFVTQSDAVRTYVDAFIHGARVVGVTSNADGTYEATVELEITPQFIACVQAPSSCGAPAPVAACSLSGCKSSSSIFTSN